eukprot:757334-Hanusia_phi.AAC.1
MDTKRHASRRRHANIANLNVHSSPRIRRWVDVVGVGVVAAFSRVSTYSLVRGVGAPDSTDAYLDRAVFMDTTGGGSICGGQPCE